MTKKALLFVVVVVGLLLTCTAGATAEPTASRPKVHRVRLQATSMRQGWASPQRFPRERELMLAVYSNGRELNNWTKPSNCRARLHARNLDLTASYCGKRLRVSYIGKVAFTMLYWLRPPSRLRG
jgi:hypothetical protein